MNKNYDLNNDNNADNNKCNVQYEFKESENVKKSEDITKKEENKFFNMKNLSNSDTNNTFNKILIETNNKLDNEDNEIHNKTAEENKFDQKNNEYKNEINNYSDNEIIVNKTVKEKNTESDQANNKYENNDIYNRLSKIIDSDSEEENIFTFNSNKNKSIYNKSEDEMSSSEYNKNHLKNKNNMKLFDSDTNDNILNKTDTEEIISNKKKITNSIKNKFQTLIDSESDEERKDDEELLNPIKHDKIKKCKEKYSKVKKVSLRASKEEAMKQIHSETQRLIRETEISLPYHKPKQRTLQEFLNRKKVITALPKAPTMAAKLKMSSIIVDEVLKEKEKEAEIFYKSSDSEDEIKEINKENTDKEMNIKCMQDLKKNNVSRKLFIDNNLSVLENNEEKNDIMKEISETLTETKEIEYNNTIINDRTEKNGTNLEIAEIHCEFNKIENKNVMSKLSETAKNEKEDLQTDFSQNKNKEKNIYIDNNKYDSEIINKHSDISTSKNNNDYAKIVKQSLGITTDESDEYNEYGLPPPKFDESPDIIKKKTLLNIKDLKPKLRGIPGTVIDLSDNIKPSKKGISALIDRFICKHSKTKEHINDIKLTTMQIKESSNGLSIIKETLPYRLSNIANEDAKLEKPGAKLKRLKEELKQKMVLKRNEEWKQKEEEMKEQEIEWNESINEEDNFNEPYSPSIESHKTEEDELEEDDMCIKKGKEKKKNIFIDDEAEVSENEINDSDEIEDEDEDEVQENSEDEIYEKLISENEDENSICDSNEASTKHKTFKRILESLDDDSKSSIIENNKNIENQTSFSQITLDNKNFKENELSDNENDIPVFQIHTKNDLEYQNQTPKIKSNTLDFISPITQLTALNAHVGEENEIITEEIAETRDLFHQMRDFNKQATLQRKLFVSQDNVLDEDLMEICSGKFPDDKFICSKFAKEANVSETQLLELCSGTFSSQPNGKELVDTKDELFQNTEVSDEKNCSYYETNEKDKQQSKEPWNKFRILSSDEEDSIEEEINKKSKKRIKKLNLSDDEEDSSAISSNDEHDDEKDDDEKFIDYDSEENEIIIPKKNIKQYAAKFLEEEAELSESDCDVSADEDEQDLDKLEFEDGDNEEIDETKVKNQIGKLHMRQLLDEDQREVRMLQELLFEDGDLFSESTRERKFKWRNIDKQDDNDNSQPLEDKDGWVDLSDDEDEAKWRKIRHEREKFLAEKMKNVDTEIEDELNSSKIFKFGLKILKKRRIDESQKQNTLIEALDSEPKLKVPYSITEILNTSELNQTSRMIHNVMQKRSFLAKGEETLTRLAALAKRKETPLSTINAKNFVFTHVDVNTEDENVSITKQTQQKEIKNKINKKN